MRRAWLVIALGLAASADPGFAQTRLADSLAGLSLEQLSNVRVTSVSRRAEPLAGAAASVFVITAEDIRRSGAKTLPEVLRLAPTLQVARADANQYAISARGSNSVLANKMLVLVDGRTVYSPLFSGTFWEEQDVVLQDIDRIEVVSGPGGTSWGTNAVNGIISIIMRPAAQTRGLLVAGGGGDQLRGAEARYGWGSGPFFRVSGKLAQQDQSRLESGGEIEDASKRFVAAGRVRWIDGPTSWFLGGGGYRNRIDQLPGARVLSGGHLLGVWLHQPERGPTFRLRASYARARRDQPGAIVDALDTYDVEFQNEWSRPRHTLVWGVGHRLQTDRLENVGPFVAFDPASKDLRYTNLFVENVLAVHPRVKLTAGLRLEHNVYTDWEYLPTLRASWTPAAGHFLWTALSRAVRAPARVDRDAFSPATPPFLLAGGPNFHSEVLAAAEVGYRAQPIAALSYSLTAFVHDYDDLRSLAPTPDGPQFENGLRGRSTGVEAWVNERVTSAWRISAGLVAMRRDFEEQGGREDLEQLEALAVDPAAWWSLRNAFDVGELGELDVTVRRVGELPASGVDAYTTVDARAAWRVHPSLEISVSGTNLVGPRHAEWGMAPNRVSFGRGAYAQLEWRL